MQKNAANSPAEQTFFSNRMPSTVVTIPATKERIDTRSYKLAAADKEILSKMEEFSQFQKTTEQLFSLEGFSMPGHGLIEERDKQASLL
jgi:hypothetical protein